MSTRYKWIKTTAVLLALAPTASCSDESSGDFAKVEAVWMRSLGEVDLVPSDEAQRIGQGDCRTGKVGGLHVDLCKYKDAVSADTARAAGLAKIGEHTGAAIVRDSTLLVVSDPDKVDPHGKTINGLTKAFANPPKLPTGI